MNSASCQPSDPSIGSFLRLDAQQTISEITTALQNQILHQLRRRGVVLGISGGIDSSVCAALSVKALGSERVFGLLMPEDDSDPESLRLGRLLADHLGISTAVENIAPILHAAGCYARRDEFIRQVCPSFDSNHRCKLVMSNVLSGSGFNLTSLVVESPEGQQEKLRLPPTVYLGIVAATNMKQRTRKQMEYYHADRLNYAVVGTPNRLEYDQGFFVKNGDGAADVKPIAHLYKTQVYDLAATLGIPDEICHRPPTTDTFSLPQTQDEFYFSLPYDKMDLCLYGLNHNFPAAEVGNLIGLTAEQTELVYRDIRSKRRATEYLHSPPLLVTPVREFQPGSH
jgi:NAD+ synthase